MNMVKINPGTARSNLNKLSPTKSCLTNTDAKDIAYYQEQNRALWRIGNEWHDIRLGASFEK